MRNVPDATRVSSWRRPLTKRSTSAFHSSLRRLRTERMRGLKRARTSVRVMSGRGTYPTSGLNASPTFIGLNFQQAQRRLSQPSRQTRAAFDRHWLPGIEAHTAREEHDRRIGCTKAAARGIGEVEDALSLEEEVALLGKK